MRRISTKCALWAIAAVAISLSACNGGGAPTVPPGMQNAQRMIAAVARHSSSSKIQHIVIIVQENRSFNNLFYGFPGAHTAKFGYDTHGNKIELQPVGLETTWDIEHDFDRFLAACNGTGSYPGTDCQMNGFDNEYWGCGHSTEPQCPNQNPPYSYVPHTETKPYFFMGKQYVLADEMYASNVDASSFISHQYIVAGSGELGRELPVELGVGLSRQQQQTTSRRLRRSANTAAILRCASTTIRSARRWTRRGSRGPTMPRRGMEIGGIWSAYQNINYVYNGPDWANDVISPQTNFFNDVSDGKLRDLSWITPTCENSDHAGCGSNTGPAWVASLVNAIGQSKYWDSTAIFIFWDDYGGWYDPKPPAMVDYDGLGMRIPMLIVSPYARRGYIDHTPFEHGTILKFVEDTFGLPRLAASDTRANSPDGAFNFNKPPRKFEVVPSEHDVNFFMHQAPDHRVPDAE